MKITPNKLILSEKVLDIIKSNKLNIGQEIEAKILKKNSQKNAILLIRGKKIVSEFINGVPETDKLNLKLDNIEKGILTFSIINKTNKMEFIGKILDYIIEKDINPLVLNKLNLNFLLNELTGIFNLNTILLESEIKNKINYTDIFKRLLELGISKDKLDLLANIIMRSSSKFYPIYSILEFFYNKKKRDFLNEPEIFNEIEEMVSELDRLCKNEKDSIKNLIDLIIMDRFEVDLNYIEFPILLNNRDYSFKYLKNKDYIVLSIEFSELGELELFINKENNEINISIYSDNKEVVNKLEESIDLFYDNVKDNRKVKVKIFNKNLIIDQIKEIIKYHLLESELDFKEKKKKRSCFRI